MAVGVNLGSYEGYPTGQSGYTTTSVDPVNYPPHYCSGDIECIDAIAASMSAPEFRGYLKGNAMKYLWRYGLKGKGLEDLKKSRWYLDRLIAELERE